MAIILSIIRILAKFARFSLVEKYKNRFSGLISAPKEEAPDIFMPKAEFHVKNGLACPCRISQT